MMDGETDADTHTIRINDHDCHMYAHLTVDHAAGLNVSWWMNRACHCDAVTATEVGAEVYTTVLA